jgi:hypothetical protein
MYAQKNIPYAYGNLRDELQELNQYISKKIPDLPKHYTHDTRQYLLQCKEQVKVLSETLSGNDSIEGKMTVGLCERLAQDIEYFVSTVGDSVDTY